jgi:hypothetical protein
MKCDDARKRNVPNATAAITRDIEHLRLPQRAVAATKKRKCITTPHDHHCRTVGERGPTEYVRDTAQSTWLGLRSKNNAKPLAF